jgi:hypothetical protein
MFSVESVIPEFKIIEADLPSFGLAKAIPDGMGEQIQKAVIDFMGSSGLPEGIDKNGFYYQTLQSIANSAIVGQGRELWLGICNGQLYTYILAIIGPDFDGRLSYMVTQAWVREDQRGKPWVREAWKKVRQRAKDTLCSHFAVLSSKANTDAYCRFLGKGFHKVSETLKEEL